MGKILEYIQQSGNGKYQCYKTKKLSLDANDNDTIAYNYDDMPEVIEKIKRQRVRIKMIKQ